ncbi:MAG TPA: carbohydrate ABC transporter permease [Nitrospiraceae bacterium]|nr:carbohydrate ABC transporter permease [Nitrospiraceae bacterium]
MRLRTILGRVILYTILLSWAAAIVVPLAYSMSSSFKTAGEVFQTPIRWIPRVWHTENYTEPFRSRPFGRFFLNSVIVATTSTALNLLVSSLAGYSLAKFRFRGRNLLFGIVLGSLMLPIQVTIVPLYLVTRSLGWINTYQGLILPTAVTGFGIFLMRQYILTIPDDFREAARIDGAGELFIFLNIILPLAAPAFFSLGILHFLASWESFMWPLVIANRDEIRPLAIGLVMFEQEFYTAYPQLFAMSLASMFPLLAVFVVFQRRILEGMILSGLKG